MHDSAKNKIMHFFFTSTISILLSLVSDVWPMNAIEVGEGNHFSRIHQFTVAVRFAVMMLECQR